MVPGQEVEPPSPGLTLSEASSLSLYSPDDVAKNLPIETQEVEEPKNSFCSCFSMDQSFDIAPSSVHSMLGFFSRKSRDKEKEAKILGPPIPKIIQPAPVPQMTQIGRRRPSPLNL